MTGWTTNTEHQGASINRCADKVAFPSPKWKGDIDLSHNEPELLQLLSVAERPFKSRNGSRTEGSSR